MWKLPRGAGRLQLRSRPLPLLAGSLRPPPETLSSVMRMEIGVRSRLYFSGLQAEAYKVQLRAMAGVGENRKEAQMFL